MRLPNLITSKKRPKDVDGAVNIRNLARENYFTSLPSEASIREVVGEVFVINQPLNGVGGDGYCLIEVQACAYFIVAYDCMGHGHLAAMMTRKCDEFIKSAIVAQHIYDPASILSSIHKQIFEEFGDSSNSMIGTGIDMAVIAVNEKEDSLSYAGAKMDLIALDRNGLSRHIAHKRSLGANYDVDRTYETHTFSLKDYADKNLYLYSDGATDLFGGAKGKKLQFSGLKSIIEASIEIPLAEQKKYFTVQFEKWEGNQDRLDDLLFLGLRIIL